MSSAELLRRIMAHPDITRPPNGNGEALAWCPWHADKAGGNPSLTINVHKGIAWCFPCDRGGLEELAKAWGLVEGGGGSRTANDRARAHSFNSGQSEKRERARNARVHTQGCTLKAYAEAKKIPISFLRGVGVKEVYYLGEPALQIPYPTFDSSPGPVRYRTALSGDDKFRWRKGDKPSVYGLDLKNFDRARKFGYMVIGEGESDAQTCWLKGIPFLGVPGASSFHLLDGVAELQEIPRLYIVREPDTGGDTFLKQLATSKFRDKAYVVSLAPHKDPSDLFVSDTQSFSTNLQKYLDSAKTWSEFQREVNQRAENEAWNLCQSLAGQIDIMAAFDDFLRAGGYVGPTTNAQLLYLAITSRLLPLAADGLPQVVSVFLKGESSSGKNYLVTVVLRAIPSDAYMRLTITSPRRLALTDTPFAHKAIVIEEMGGIDSEVGAYIIRSLLSEGRLKYAFIDKGAHGELVDREVTKEGPTLLISSTTKSIDPELATRGMTLNVTDEPDVTRAIAVQIARDGEKALPDVAPWQAHQTWLSFKDGDVSVPFFHQVVDGVRDWKAVRLRRDFKMLRTLVKSHARLHTASRRLDEQLRVIACPVHDYEPVRQLVTSILSEGIGATVPDGVRKTVVALSTLILEDSRFQEQGVTTAALARAMNVHRTTAMNRAKEGIARGVVINLSPPHKPMALKPGDPLPDDLPLLVSLAEAPCACPRAPQVHHDDESQAISDECASVPGPTAPAPPASQSNYDAGGVEEREVITL
jgi:hypothetical protein